MKRKVRSKARRCMALFLAASMCLGTMVPAAAMTEESAGEKPLAEISLVKPEISSESEGDSAYEDGSEAEDEDPDTGSAEMNPDSESTGRDPEEPANEKEENGDDEEDADAENMDADGEASEDAVNDAPVDFLFDPQPETLEAAQEAIDRYEETGVYPVWEFAVATELLPPNYVCVEMVDETTGIVYWTVTLGVMMAPPETEVTVSTFAELSAALLAASADPEVVTRIKLTSDIEAPNNTNTGIGTTNNYITGNIILDGQNHTLNMRRTHFRLGGKAEMPYNLTVENITLVQTTSDSADATLYGLFCIYEGGTGTTGMNKDLKWNACFENVIFSGTALIGTYDNVSDLPALFPEGVPRRFDLVCFNDVTMTIGGGYRAFNAVVYAENIEIAGRLTMQSGDSASSGGTDSIHPTLQSYFKVPGTGKDGLSYESASQTVARGSFVVKKDAKVSLTRAPGWGTLSWTDAASRYYRSLILNFADYVFEDGVDFYAKAGTNRNAYALGAANESTDMRYRNALIRSNNARSFQVLGSAKVTLETDYQNEYKNNKTTAAYYEQKGFTALSLRKTDHLDIVVEGTLSLTGGGPGNLEVRGTAPILIWGPGSSTTEVTGTLDIFSDTANAWYYEYRNSLVTTKKQTFIVKGENAVANIVGNNNKTPGDISFKGTSDYAGFEAYGAYDVDIQVLDGAIMNVFSNGYRGMSLASSGQYKNKSILVDGHSRLDITGYVWAIAAETQPILNIKATNGGVINLTSAGSDDENTNEDVAASTVYSVGPTTYTADGVGSQINLLHKTGTYSAIFHDGYGALKIHITNGGAMNVENYNTGDRDARRAAICAQNTNVGRYPTSTGNEIIVDGKGSSLYVINHNDTIHTGTYWVNQFATGAIQIGGYSATATNQNAMTGNIVVSNGADFTAISNSLAPTVYLQFGKITLDNPGHFEIRNDATKSTGIGSAGGAVNYNNNPYSGSSRDFASVGQAVWNGRAYTDSAKLSALKSFQPAIEFVNCDITAWSVMKNDPEYSGGGYVKEQIDYYWLDQTFIADNGQDHKASPTESAGIKVAGTTGILNKWTTNENEFALSAYGRITGNGKDARLAAVLEAEKTSDRKLSTRVEDLVTYTITVRNSGNIPAYEVVVNDLLPVGVELVADSVTVAGEKVAYQEEDRQLSIAIGDLAAEAEIEIIFRVEVQAGAAGTSIENTGQVTGYTEPLEEEEERDPESEPDLATNFSDENKALIKEKAEVKLKVTKTSTRRKDQLTKVGDTVIYTIVVKNDGADTIYDVVVYDNIATGLELNAGSITMGGTVISDYTYVDGILSFNLGALASGQEVTILFAVTVTAEAAGQSIENTGMVTGYMDGEDDREPDHEPEVEVEFTDGNEDKVKEEPRLTGLKTSNRSGAEPTKVGDTITYTILVKNEGKGRAQDVKVNDLLAPGLYFLDGSVTIASRPAAAGEYQLNGDLLTVWLGDLDPGAETTITFQVKVTKKALGQSIRNIGTITDAEDGPGPGPEPGVDPDLDDENDEKVVAGDKPVLDVRKTSNRSQTVSTKVGETVDYIISLQNTGLATAFDVQLQDRIPTGVTLDEGSVKIDGRTATDFAYDGAILTVGLGDLAKDQQVNITFTVAVTADAVGHSIENTGTVTGYTEAAEYREPDELPDVAADFSDENKGEVREVTNLIGEKNSDRDDTESTKVGDVVTYTIVVENQGKGLVKDVKINDQIPAGVRFLEGTVTIGGVVAGNDNYQLNDDLLTIWLGDLAPDAKITTTFQVKVTKDALGKSIRNVGTITDEEAGPGPGPGPKPGVDPDIDDEDNRPVEAADKAVLEAKKISDRSAATSTKVGERITYTITVKNAGKGLAYDVELRDYLASGVTLDKDTIAVNGAMITGHDYDNDTLTIGLGDLAEGQEAIVTFVVDVTASAVGHSIENTGLVTGYTEGEEDREPNAAPDLADEFSDENRDLVREVTNLAGHKTSDRRDDEPTRVGDTVTYTIEVRNEGKGLVKDVKVNDQITAGVRFVDGSVTIGGLKAGDGKYQLNGDLLTIWLGDLAPQEVVTATFQVKVTKDALGKTIRNLGTITDEEDGPGPGPGPKPNPEPGEEPDLDDEDNRIVEPAEKPALQVSKTSDRSVTTPTKVGETVDYQIFVKNDGSGVAYDVELKDKIPAGVALMEDTIKVNGRPITDFTVVSGFLTLKLGDLGKNDDATITFTVAVTAGAVGQSIENTGVITGYYEAEEDREAGQEPDVELPFTDGHEGKVREAVKLAVQKTSDRSQTVSTKVGDTICYTISIKNMGPGPAHELVLQDVITKWVTLVDGTVEVGGKPITDYTLENGVLALSLGDLQKDDEVIITFAVTVNEDAAGQSIENTGTVTGYTDPAEDRQAGVKPDLEEPFSDENSSEVREVTNLVGQKTSDRDDEEPTKVGDIVTYTIVVENQGKGPVKDVKVNDRIATGVQFVEESVTIAGIEAEADEYALNGDLLTIWLGDLEPGEKITATFQVKVTVGALGKSIRNVGTITDEEAGPDPGPGPEPGVEPDLDDEDDRLVEEMDKPVLEAEKTSNRSTTVATKIGETVLYAIQIKNAGKATAYDVQLNDFLAAGVSLDEDSVKVSGQAITDYQVGGGILALDLGDLEPNQELIVTFAVEVNEGALGQSIENTGTITGYMSKAAEREADAEPDVSAVFSDGNTGAVKEVPNLVGHKTSNRSLIEPTKVGDIVTYTIKIKNEGKATVNDVKVNDRIAVGVRFLEDTVTVGEEDPETVKYELNDDLLTIWLGDLEPNQEITATFQVKVTEEALDKSIRNIGTITDEEAGPGPGPGPEPGVNPDLDDEDDRLVEAADKAVLEAKKTSNRSDAIATKIGDTVIYTIVVKNTGAAKAYDVELQDFLAAGVTLDEDSIKVDEVEFSDYRFADDTLIMYLGDLSADAEVTVAFAVTVAATAFGQTIENTGIVTGHTTSDEEREDEAEPDLEDEFSDGNLAEVKEVPNLVGQKTSDRDRDRPTQVGDMVTYTIVVRNEGQALVKDVKVNDLIAYGVHLLENSVFINGSQAAPDHEYQLNDDLLTIWLGDLGVQDEAVITFSVKVTADALGKSIRNIGTITDEEAGPGPGPGPNPDPAPDEEYDLDDENDDLVVARDIPELIVQKTSDRSFTKVGDEVTYTILVANTGKGDAYELVLNDYLAAGVTLDTDSVKINGTRFKGWLFDGQTLTMDLGDLGGGAERTITFAVTVNADAAGQSIENTGNVTGYTIADKDREPDDKPDLDVPFSDHNQVEVREVTNLVGTKTSDRAAPTKVGDTVTYTIVVKNEGKGLVKDVKVNDKIAAGLRFLYGTVTIGGREAEAEEYQLNEDLLTIWLGDLAAGDEVTITFQVKVTKAALGQSIRNIGTISDEEAGPGPGPAPNPNPEPGEEHDLDDKNDDPVVGSDNAVLDATKTSNRSTTVSTKVGERIAYAIVVENIGEDTAYDVVLSDNIAVGVTLDLTSLKVNGAKPDQYDFTGEILNLYLGDLKPGEKAVTVEFEVTVNADAAGKSIENTGIVTGYTEERDERDPGAEPNVRDTFTDGNDSQVREVTNLTGAKTSDRSSDTPTKVGDTVTYTIVVSNAGLGTVKDVKVNDRLALGLRILEDSVTIAGSQAAADDYELNGDLLTIWLGDLDPGEQVTITFRVRVTKAAQDKSIRNIGTISDEEAGPGPGPAPNPNPEPGEEHDLDDKNDDPVVAGKPELSVKKTSNREEAATKVGDQITYTIVVANTGETILYDVELQDNLAAGVALDTTSIKVDGVEFTDFTDTGGILILDLGVMEINDQRTVTFDVKVDEKAAGKSIENTGTVTGYVEEREDRQPGDEPDVEKYFSDENTTKVKEEDKEGDKKPKLVGTKTSDRADHIPTKVGDIVTYTIKVKNEGDATAKNVEVYDYLPKGVQFLVGTVAIGGIIADENQYELSSTGPTGNTLLIKLGDLAEDKEITITFQVKVTKEASGKQIRNIGNIIHDEKEPDPEAPDIDDEDGGYVEDADKGVLEAKKYSDRKDPTRVGDTITYTIEVENIGLETVYDIMLEDQLPAGVTLVEDSVKIGDVGVPYTEDNGIIRVDLSHLLENQKVAVSLQVTVDESALGKIIENTGMVAGYSEPEGVRGQADEPDIEADFRDGNTSKIEGEDVEGDKPVLEAKVFSNRSQNNPTKVGETITYTIEVENIGKATAYDVQLKDNIPVGVDLDMDSIEVNNIAFTDYTYIGAVLTLSLGNLEENEKATASLAVDVTEGAIGQSIENTGTVSGYSKKDHKPDDEPDVEEYFSDKNTSKVEGEDKEEDKKPKLVGTKASDRTDHKPTKVGDIVTYTIKVKNEGDATAKNVEVYDYLPKGVSFLVGTVTIGGIIADENQYELSNTGPTGNTLLIKLGDLAEDKGITITFQVKVTKEASGEQIRNIGNVIHDEKEPDPEAPDIDDKDGGYVEDADKPVLEAKKYSDRKDPTRVGDTVTYTILVENVGTETAYDVVLKDQLAVGVSLVSGSVKVNGERVGYTADSEILSVNMGNIEAKKIVTVSLQVTVNESAKNKSIENIGTIAGYSEPEEVREPGAEPDVEEDFTDDNKDKVEEKKTVDPGGPGGGGGGGGNTGDDGLKVVYHSEFSILPVTENGKKQGDTIAVKEGTIFTASSNRKFLGWSDQEGGLTVVYYGGDTFLMPNRDVHLHAVYEEDEFLLNFDDHYAYVVGYPDGTVRPDSLTTREEVATIFFRLLTDDVRDSFWRTTNSFVDVQAGRWSNNAISTLANGGIVAGYPDGSFRPEHNITRAEMAVIAAQFDSTTDSGADQFHDISGHWAQDYINRAAVRGWISGYHDGTFRPDDYITRAEVMTLVNMVLGRNPQSEEDLLDEMLHWPDNADPGVWYYLHVQEATNSHHYDRNEDGYETWIQLRPNRDWAALEQR